MSFAPNLRLQRYRPRACHPWGNRGIQFPRANSKLVQIRTLHSQVHSALTAFAITFNPCSVPRLPQDKENDASHIADTKILLRPDKSTIVHAIPEEVDYYLNGRGWTVYKLTLQSRLGMNLSFRVSMSEN